jgi:hypothetical protein
MRKSEQFSVAIFLAVALFAGTIAGSAPAFVVDAQATEDKRDYKEKDKYHDKDSRYDDNKKYGGHDDYGKDRENKYSKYDRDRHDDKSSVKYIKCNNVNINGKGGHSGGNDNWPRGGGNEWPRDGGNEWPRGGDNHNVPGFVKHTNKDVVVICIFNNDKKDKDKEPLECDECISNLPGRSPNPMQENGTGLERDFIEFLINSLSVEGEEPLTAEEAIAEFCALLEAGEFSVEDLEMLIDEAIPPGMNSNPQETLLACLSALIPVV